MAVAHFPSGSVLTCSTFLETANAGDVGASSVAEATQVASAPLLNDSSHRSSELGTQTTPHERPMTHLPLPVALRLRARRAEHDRPPGSSDPGGRRGLTPRRA